MKATVYNQEGKKTGELNLPENIFGLPWNADLVHQVVVSVESNKRSPIAHTKGRGEVRGGGKKPWKQKGTGRARHGSSRSPIWKGGGVTFGPTNERNFKKKVNRKMMSKALYTVLSRKLKDGELLFVDDISMQAPKTTQAKEILSSMSSIPNFEKLSTKKRNNALIALGKSDENIKKSFRNFGNISVGEIKNINPVEVLKYKYLVVSEPKEAVEFLESKLKSKKEVAGKVTPKTAKTKEKKQ